MKAIFTLVSLLLSTLALANDNFCLDKLSIALNSQDEAELFAIDVLLEVESVTIEDYVIAIEDGTPQPFISLTAADIGKHSYTVTNTSTSDSCKGTLVVSESFSSSILAVCNDKLVVAKSLFMSSWRDLVML